MENEFNRKDGLFSLCGLNCGLCPMQIRGECSGCFTGSTCYISCPIAHCSKGSGNIEYCFKCKEYPCQKYDGVDEHDSLIYHRNQNKDMLKAKEIGIDMYLAELQKKRDILKHLLFKYDDGSKDVFFCLAVNMIELGDLEKIVKQADESFYNMTTPDKSKAIEKLIRTTADKNGVFLQLRPW